MVTQFYGQSVGTYDHYFYTFLPPGDVLELRQGAGLRGHGDPHPLLPRLQRLGRPSGVGVAVGRAVRTSIVAVNVIDLFLSMAIWGDRDGQAGGVS